MTVQNYNNPWALAAHGALTVPFSIGVQTAAVVAGSKLFDMFPLQAAKDAFFSSTCSVPAGRNLPAAAAGVTYEILKVVPFEEFTWRTLFQNYLLTKAVSKISPSLSSHPIMATLRVGLSALAFSALHLMNRGNPGMTPEMSNIQLANTFGLGLSLAMLQETTGSTWAPIGLHAAWNLIGIALAVSPCFSSSPEKIQAKASSQTIPSTDVCKIPTTFEGPTCSAENQQLADRAAEYKEKQQQAESYARFLEERVEDRKSEAAEFEKKAGELLARAQEPYFAGV